jgi:predicted house-cleaning NTP pyrophosphatase (Maf/HAM1 superfamily)
MLARWAPQLQNLRIVLASQSPRRQELLRNNLGVNFEVILSGFAEDIEKVS